MKNANKRLRIIAILIICIPLCFYVLPKVIIQLTICNIQELSYLWQYSLITDYCPEEAEQLYENVFLQECAKRDEQLLSNTELLISACTDPEVRGVPGGEKLFVNERKTGEIYLLDLRTGEKKQIPNYPHLLERGIFLSSELVWLEGVLLESSADGYRSDYILDLTDGQTYELINLNNIEFQNKLLENGELKPELLTYITKSEKIFIHYRHNKIIALSPDFRHQPDKNIIFHQSIFGQRNVHAKRGELLEQLVKDLGLSFERIDLSLEFGRIPSPTGKYFASHNGIFLSGTNISLTIDKYPPGYYLGIGGGFISWYYDESGFVFTQGGNYYVQDSLWGNYFYIPSPILKFFLSTK